MASVLLKNVTKTYPHGFAAVKDVSLEIEDGELIVLTGPSGCGKSTVLRMIAGLDDITAGELYIDGKQMNDVESRDRDIAMVFQNYVLYPDMSVYENLAFGLKLRNMPKNEIDRLVQETAHTLDLAEILDKKPAALSDVQKQRVVMGRAIVRQPKVLLMDEPLSNLDTKMRAQMRVELSRLHQKLGMTMIYVTDDRLEAMTLGTRVVVIKDGAVQQVDTPRNLYHKPVNIFVAGFIGELQMHLMDATVETNGDRFWLNLGENTVELTKEKGSLLEEAGYVGKEVILGIQSEDPSKIHVFDKDTGNVIFN